MLWEKFEEYLNANGVKLKKIAYVTACYKEMVRQAF
jgi:hypothetical protein